MDVERGREERPCTWLCVTWLGCIFAARVKERYCSMSREFLNPKSLNDMRPCIEHVQLLN